METKIQKWGNSLALRLPKALTQRLTLREGSIVQLTEDSKHRIIIKQIPKKKASLGDLVSKITQDNLHKETDWDVPQGKEVW